MKEKFATYRTKIVITGLQSIASGSNFLLVIILTRLYGLHIFGIYSMLWIVQIFSMNLHQSAVLSPLVTLWPKNETKAYWSKFFVYNLLVSCLLAVGAFLFTHFAGMVSAKWNISAYSWQMLLIVFTFTLHLFNRRSMMNLQLYVAAFLADFFVYIPILFVIIFNKPSLGNLLYLQVLAIFTGVLTGLIALRSHIKLKGIGSTFLREVSKFSGWLILTSTLQWFSGNFFLIAVGSLIGPSGMGIIRMGQSTMGVFSVLFLAIENRVPFSASRILKVEGKYSFRKYMLDLLKKGGVFIVTGVGLVAATSVFLISKLYGQQYESYYWVLILFALLQLFVFISTLIQISLRTIEQTQLIFFAYVLTSLTSVALAFPLVRHFGIPGAIAGLFITQIIAIVWYLLNLAKKWKQI